MRYDTTLKELFQSPPIQLLTLIAGEAPAELLTVEFPTVKMRRPDLVFRQRDGQIRQVELQSDNDETMDYRMLEYYPLLWRLFGQPPIQTVLYVGSKRLTMTGRVQHPRLQYSYEVMDIRQFDAAPLLESSSAADNLLALLCHDGTTRPKIKRILQNLLHLPERERIDRLLQLLILSGLRKVEAIIQEEVKLMPLTINLMENKFFRDAFLGGKEEGQEIGRKEGQSHLLNRMLEHRFGKLPKWALEQLAMADAPTLEQWGLKLFDAKKLDEVVPRATTRRRSSKR